MKITSKSVFLKFYSDFLVINKLENAFYKVKTAMKSDIYYYVQYVSTLWLEAPLCSPISKNKCMSWNQWCRIYHFSNNYLTLSIQTVIHFYSFFLMGSVFHTTCILYRCTFSTYCGKVGFFFFKTTIKFHTQNI